MNKPNTINIYPKDFDSKEMISNIITDYNNAMILIEKGEKKYARKQQPKSRNRIR